MSALRDASSGFRFRAAQRCARPAGLAAEAIRMANTRLPHAAARLDAAGASLATNVHGARPSGPRG